MEVELSAVASVPMGMVSSIFIHGAGASGQVDYICFVLILIIISCSLVDAQYNVSSKTGDVLVSMCPSGRLLTFISSYKAQFVACEGT